MEYFKSLTQQSLVDLISSTKEHLFLCLPSIHKELADAITYLDHSASFDNREVGIHLLVDFDAQTFRQGYGDYKSLEDLIKGNFEVRTLKDNRISFVISDEIGYYLFIESRSLIPADKETINTVRIDPVSIVRLKKFFFSEAIKMDFEDELTNAIIEESKQLGKAKELLSQQIATVEELPEEKLTAVGEELKKNPPLNPDYKRIVEFYSNKFQYVKLKFEGANLQHRKIEIPAKALPIADANLKKRLETKLNLFDPAKAATDFSPLHKLKEKVLEVRTNYLTKVKSREESLLNKESKSDFEKVVNTLQNIINETKSKTLTQISEQISSTKKQLLVDLVEFLEANPKALFPDHPHLWQNNQEYIRSAANSKAEEIIYRIKWPEAHALVDDFKLEVQYSDITFEDLKNKQFIDELKDCGLINSADEHQLAEFSKGIETK